MVAVSRKVFQLKMRGRFAFNQGFFEVSLHCTARNFGVEATFFAASTLSAQSPQLQMSKLTRLTRTAQNHFAVQNNAHANCPTDLHNQHVFDAPCLTQNLFGNANRPAVCVNQNGNLKGILQMLFEGNGHEIEVLSCVTHLSNRTDQTNADAHNLVVLNVGFLNGGLNKRLNIVQSFGRVFQQKLLVVGFKLHFPIYPHDADVQIFHQYFDPNGIKSLLIERIQFGRATVFSFLFTVFENVLFFNQFLD